MKQTDTETTVREAPKISGSGVVGIRMRRDELAAMDKLLTDLGAECAKRGVRPFHRSDMLRAMLLDWCGCSIADLGAVVASHVQEKWPARKRA